ncbi:hypothetical protein Zmor_011325, partial [Zophobas morio]
MTEDTNAYYSEDKRSGIFSPVFIKKSDVIHKSVDYEHFYISNLIWKLKLYADIIYCISSHDQEFIPFDDVIIEMKEDDKPKKEIYAIKFQFTNGRKALRVKDLTTENGEFTILKFVDQLKHLPEDTNAILYTDATFSANNGQKIVLDLETDVTVWKHRQNWRIANCYGLHEGHKIEIRKSNRTFTLFLYSGEFNLKKLQQEASEKFKYRLYTDDTSYNNFVNFIYKWDKIEGKKEKLSNSILERAAALFIVSPFIKSISFSSKPVSENTKLLRETISKFDVTVFAEESCDEVTSLWRDAKAELRNLKKLNRMRTRYQIMFQNIAKVEDLDDKDEEATKLLWLMGKCPLIVNGQTKAVFAAFWLIRSTFIVINPLSLIFEQRKFFTLADLKIFEPDAYGDVVQKFKCLIQNKEASLYDVIQECDELDNIITTNELLHMVDYPLASGETKTSFIGCSNLKISRPIIHCRFLNEFTKDTAVVVYCMSNAKKLKKFCGDFKMVKVDMLDDSTISSSGRAEILDKAVYVSTQNMSKGHFSDFCSKYSSKIVWHYFRFDSDECLEWVQSTNDVNDLQKFQLEQYFLEDVRCIG